MFTFVYNHYNMCSAVAAATATSVAAARFICFEAQKIFKLQILMKCLETMEHLTAHNKIMLQHNNNISTYTDAYTRLMPWKFLSISCFVFISILCSLSRWLALVNRCEFVTINQKFRTKAHLSSRNIDQQHMLSLFPLAPPFT